MQLFIATKNGLATAVKEGGEWQKTGLGLQGHHITSVIAREGVILAGTRDGIYRSADSGQTWQETSAGLKERHVRWLAFHPDISDFEMAGTEPAALFISRDGGDSWQERPEVAALRDEFGWWLPYSPEAGCVRGFAVHGQRLYAAVEVGGLLHSTDGGQSWTMVEGSEGRPQFGRPPLGKIHPDVHSVVVHALSAERLFAPTAGGLYASQDGGVSWRNINDDCYARAVWVDPQDADRIIFGPSDGPSGRNGRIEVSQDGGLTWRKTEGWTSSMVERFVPLGDTLFAVLDDGQLLETALPSDVKNLSGLAWRKILSTVPNVNDVACL